MNHEIPQDKTVAMGVTEPEQLPGAVKASHNTFCEPKPAVLDQQNRVTHDPATSSRPDSHSGMRGKCVDVRELQEENEALRNDNEQLRALIVERSMASEPLRGEQFYSQQFRELLAEVETWVAKMDKSRGLQELSTNTANDIVERLGRIGRRGQSSADFLKKNNTLFWRAYRTPTSRIQLERHLVAAILFDNIFSPFAFGLLPEWAEALAWIVEDIEKTGMAKTND
jgi:hypothetical protein